ncbi:MAG TPA: EAL domain-containing protein [Candidatus Solibacter sp.]|nr:EAL domain-containing protein [Candidatus Solibacter sp.]
MEPIRLLIADDDPIFVKSLIKSLTSDSGIDIVGVAGDAPETIRMAVELQPEVVLCDVSMPGGGGPVACVGIRESSPTTRVIAHSMYDDRGAVMHMVRAGAIGYVLKGSPRDLIMSTLERARNGEASLSGHVASLVVNELSATLRDHEREAERRRQDLAAIRRLASGDGIEVRLEPIVDLGLDSLVGVEAIPWRPALVGVEGETLESWMATASSVGYGAELDFALARICMAKLDDVPPWAWRAIKVAPTTLLDPAFADGLRAQAPETVCLEVGDWPGGDYDQLRRALDQIRGPKVTLAVDGLGSNGSALRQVAELRPDFVKLHPWVMERGLRDGFSPELVKTMANLVTGAGSQLVVCGVHNETEMQMLRDLNVRFAQGRNLVRASGAGPFGQDNGGEPPIAIAK